MISKQNLQYKAEQAEAAEKEYRKMPKMIIRSGRISDERIKENFFRPAYGKIGDRNESISCV